MSLLQFFLSHCFLFYDLFSNSLEQRNITQNKTKTSPSNKTPALIKSTNIWIWVVAATNQLFKEVLKLKQNFRKNKVVTGKTPLFVIGPLCSHHFICLNIGFWYGSLVWKCVFNLSFQLKNGTPIFWKRFSFSRKSISKVKYWKRLKFPLIVKGNPCLKSVKHILQWWKLAVIPYPKEIQKIYESRDTPLAFCWHQHFFTGNQQILLYQEIQI